MWCKSGPWRSSQPLKMSPPKSAPHKNWFSTKSFSFFSHFGALKKKGCPFPETFKYPDMFHGFEHQKNPFWIAISSSFFCFPNSYFEIALQMYSMYSWTRMSCYVDARINDEHKTVDIASEGLKACLSVNPTCTSTVNGQSPMVKVCVELRSVQMFNHRRCTQRANESYRFARSFKYPTAYRLCVVYNGKWTEVCAKGFL